jgi:hypothetical protein
MSAEPEPPELPTPAHDAVVTDQAAAHVRDEHGHHGPFHTHCENCGTKLEGPWCYRCGQHDFEFHRSFWHVFLEALENLFHFEGKFFRNIVTLMFQPGRLTAAFNAGHRAAQMPPFRLYVFVSFLFFLLIFLGKNTAEDRTEPVAVTRISEAWREAAAKLNETDWKDPARVNLAIEQAAAKAAQADPAITSDGGLIVQDVRSATEMAQAAIAAEEAKENAGATSDKKTTESTGFLRYLEKQGKRLGDPAHRQRLAASIKSHLPQMLMFCLPWFALYTRVLFRKSGQVYLQHLVLAVHFHTFIYLWILFARGWTSLAGLASGRLEYWVGFACNAWLCVYPFFMLRRLFGNSWTKTAIKTVFLAGIYTTTLGLGFIAMAALIFFTA